MISITRGNYTYQFELTYLSDCITVIGTKRGESAPFLTATAPLLDNAELVKWCRNKLPC